MNDKDTKAVELSLTKNLFAGMKAFTSNFRKVAKALLFMTILIAVAAAATFGGNIGAVKVDGITYMPFHEIAMSQFLVYAAGTFILLLLYTLWQGGAFIMLGGDAAPKHKFKDCVLNGLKLLQFCLLTYLVFGVLGTVIIVLAVKVSAWLWILAALYFIYFSVAIYVSEYNYMLTDDSYRASLKLGLWANRMAWGRVFLRLLVVYAAAVFLTAVVLLPAFALLMGVYDNATAVALEGAKPTPVMVFVLEYAMIALGVMASLMVTYCAKSVLKAFFDETSEYKKVLSEQKDED